MQVHLWPEALSIVQSYTIKLGRMWQLGSSPELVSMQVSSGVTEGGRRLVLNRDGEYRVTYTCVTSTCPDCIHLHTKTHGVHLTQSVGHCKHAWRAEDH